MRMLLLAAFIAATPVQAADRDPLHRQRITVALPADPEPPLRPGDISLTVPDVDPDITDIPLTYPDPATMALKQRLEHSGEPVK